MVLQLQSDFSFSRFVLWLITFLEKRKMVSVIRLLVFSAIFNVAESTSVGSRVVYVSKVRGKALPSCGTSGEPCKTLEQGLDKLAWKGKLYIDGQGTEKNPYTCKLGSSSSKGLKIKKSFTLLSYANSTARISCSNGIVIENSDKSLSRRVRVKLTKVMFIDSKRLWVKDGINITLNGVLFKNTTLQLKNAWSSIQDCNFQNSYPAIDVYISNTLPFYTLEVKNTLFKENCGCIEINQPRKAKGCNRKIVVKLQDILFQGNTILMTTKPKGKESGLVYFRGSKNCNCKPQMSFISKWENVTVTDSQGQVKLCNKTRKEQKDCCWRRKESPDDFTRNIYTVHACRIDLRFWKVKSLNNVNTRFLMSQSSYSNITIKNSSYGGHHIDDEGGVIRVKSSSLEATSRVILVIDDSVFVNNSGTLGGVLQIDGGNSRNVELNMSNVSFLHSNGSDFGCVVSVAKVNYEKKSRFTHAASITAYFKRVLVNDTRFSYNQTSKEHHYAAFCFSASHLSRISVTESSFCKNDVPALVLRHGSTSPSVAGIAGIKIIKTDFIENYSPRRENAVVTLMVNPLSVQMSSLNFSRTTFIKNNGTAVLAKYVIYVRAINLKCIQNVGHCMLIESNLKQWPRGISSLNSNLMIKHSVFSQNLNSPISFIHAKPRFLLIQILDTNFHENRAALRIEVGHKQNNTLISGKLDIKRTNFTSNLVSNANILSVILMVPTNAKFRTRISKAVFRNNVQYSKGYHPDISSLFFFYMPDDFEVPKNKRCRKFPFFNYTLRQRSFREVIFENNTGVSSMLHICNGFNSFSRCIFKNSFAKYPRSGAHVFVEEGTARVMFRHTEFEQTNISNCKPCNDSACKHSSVLPFVNTGARGPLIVLNSSFTLHISERKTKMFIIKNGRYVSFDSKTKLRCPIGSYIHFENSSHVILPKFTLDHCRLNITRIRFACRMCPVNTYSLQRGSFNGLLGNKTYVYCFTCPYGGNCVWNIKSKTDFWGYISSRDPPQLNFTRCPEHYCRAPRQTTNTSVYNRCSGNRTGLMCGACKKGFTESLFNHECRPVHECRDRWFWSVAVLYSVVMGVYILLRPPIVTQLVKKIMWFRHNETPSMPHRMNEQTAGTSDSHGGHGFSKIIFYFYQIAGLLMLESSTQILKKDIFVVTLISFFNFKVEVADSSFGCPFPGLTAVTKELFRSSQVFAVMVFLLVLYFLHWLLWVIRRRPRPHFAPYLAAIIEVLLLGYERLGHTSFDLLQCTALNMNGQKVWKMFIDGNITCWVHWWQFAMIAYNIVFVIPFMLVLLVGTSKLQRAQIGPFQFLAACFVPLPFLVYWLLTMKRTKDKRPSDSATGKAPYQQYRKHLLEVIQGPFRPPKNQSKGALYWESILIGRRLVLLCLHSLVPTPMLRILSMTLCCLLILLQDVVVMPFKERKMNALAIFLLCIHVVLGAINLAKATLITAAVTPRGPPRTQMHGLQWLEVILLGILPFVFLLLVVACLVSQAIRLIIKASLCIFKISFQGRSRGRNTSLEESLQPFLDPTIDKSQDC